MASKSNTSVGIDVTVQGERAFRASLSEINAALRVNNAEIEAVSEAYKGNEKSIDALTAKQDALDRSILTQKERLEALESALKKTGEKYGETDTRTLRLRESLIKAQTQLEKTKRELNDTSEELDKAKENTGNLSVSLSDLADKAGINLPPALQTLTENMDGATTAGAALVGVLAGIVTGLAKATTSTAENAKQLKTMSQETGLTVEQLQELQYTSAALGIEEDEVQDKMKDLVSAMRDARDGSEDMQGAFKRLGVEVTDRSGELKSAGDVFYEVVDALGEVSNRTERDALAMQIFGEEAQKLNPIFDEGKGALQRYAQEANSLGYVMDTKTVESFSELGTQFVNFNKQIDAVKNQFAIVLLPVLTNLLSIIASLSPEQLKMLITLGAVVTTIIAMAKAVKGITDLTSSLSSFFSSTNTGAAKTLLIISAVVGALILILGLIALIKEGKEGFEDSLDNLKSSASDISGSISGKVNQANSNYQRIAYHAKGTMYHQGGWAVVGEEGPELIDLPVGSRVYTASQTRKMIGTGNGTVNYYVTIDAKSVKEFDDIVRIANQKKSSIRQGNVKK